MNRNELNRELSSWRSDVLAILRRVLKTDPILVERLNATETTSLGLARFPNSPRIGWATIATIGLSEHQLRTADNANFPGRIELLALSTMSTSGLELGLAAIAFYCIKHGKSPMPGDVYSDVLARAVPGTTTPHCFLTDPYAWQDLSPPLEAAAVGGHQVYWLMAVPITDGELALHREHGEQALSELLEARGVDVTNLWRPSSI
ncbi:MAG: suppressor of fused domain protein [Phycisphaerales bacterium]